MTAAERLLWQRVQRRAAGLTPEMAAAVLRSFANVRDGMTEAAIVRAVQLGGVERLFQEVLAQAVLDVAFAPVRDRLRSQVITGVRFYARDLPKVAQSKTLAIGFDILNPRMIDAVRTLETRVVTTLQASVRDVVLAHAENALRDGVNPRELGRSLRTVIGLAPNQEQAVRNYAAALRGDGRNPLDYQLRDKRFDGTVRKGALTDTQIEKMTDAYRKKMISFNAETHARTATLDAQKAAQKLSWIDAIEKGAVDRRELMKRWVGVMDDRERDEHREMEGETVPFDQPYSNGEDIPGSSTWNCRCISRFFVA